MFECANLCCAPKSVDSSFLLVPKVKISPILDGSYEGVSKEETFVIICGMLFSVIRMGYCSTKEHEGWELVSLMLLLSKMFVAIMSQRLVSTLVSIQFCFHWRCDDVWVSKLLIVDIVVCRRPKKNSTILPTRGVQKNRLIN